MNEPKQKLNTVDFEQYFDWGQISCPQFKGMLWYNSRTKEYESNGKEVEQEDQRLIDYLEMSKQLKPI